MRYYCPICYTNIKPKKDHVTVCFNCGHTIAENHLIQTDDIREWRKQQEAEWNEKRNKLNECPGSIQQTT